jgi:hypothetical protein
MPEDGKRGAKLEERTSLHAMSKATGDANAVVTIPMTACLAIPAEELRTQAEQIAEEELEAVAGGGGAGGVDTGGTGAYVTRAHF